MRLRKAKIRFLCIVCGRHRDRPYFGDKGCRCGQRASSISYPNGSCINCKHIATDTWRSPGGHCTKHNIDTGIQYVCKDYEERREPTDAELEEISANNIKKLFNYLKDNKK